MKKTIVRFILVTGILLALSATTAMADGGGKSAAVLAANHCLPITGNNGRAADCKRI